MISNKGNTNDCLDPCILIKISFDWQINMFEILFSFLFSKKSKTKFNGSIPIGPHVYKTFPCTCTKCGYTNIGVPEVEGKCKKCGNKYVWGLFDEGRDTWQPQYMIIWEYIKLGNDIHQAGPLGAFYNPDHPLRACLKTYRKTPLIIPVKSSNQVMIFDYSKDSSGHLV